MIVAFFVIIVFLVLVGFALIAAPRDWSDRQDKK